MGFNYAKEKIKFNEAWKKLQQEYEAAGMASKDIEAMRTYDWEEFCSRRTFENHTQPLPDTYLSGDSQDVQSSLFKKFSSLSTSFDAEDFLGRYTWIDAISNADLCAKLVLLPAKDLELLTLYAIEGHTQMEIASLLGRDQSVISRKINRLKKFLKK